MREQTNISKPLYITIYEIFVSFLSFFRSFIVFWVKQTKNMKTKCMCSTHTVSAWTVRLNIDEKRELNWKLINIIFIDNSYGVSKIKCWSPLLGSTFCRFCFFFRFVFFVSFRVYRDCVCDHIIRIWYNFWLNCCPFLVFHHSFSPLCQPHHLNIHFS